MWSATGTDHAVWVDDEDEFVEHQVLFGYPPEWSTAHVLRATGCAPPSSVRQMSLFGTASRAWLARLARLTASYLNPCCSHSTSLLGVDVLDRVVVVVVLRAALAGQLGGPRAGHVQHLPASTCSGSLLTRVVRAVTVRRSGPSAWAWITAVRNVTLFALRYSSMYSSPLDDDRVTFAQALGDVLGEVAPQLDVVPGGRAVDRRLAAADPPIGRHSQPQPRLLADRPLQLGLRPSLPRTVISVSLAISCSSRSRVPACTGRPRVEAWRTKARTHARGVLWTTVHRPSPVGQPQAAPAPSVAVRTAWWSPSTSAAGSIRSEATTAESALVTSVRYCSERSTPSAPPSGSRGEHHEQPGDSRDDARSADAHTDRRLDAERVGQCEQHASGHRREGADHEHHEPQHPTPRSAAVAGVRQRDVLERSADVLEEVRGLADAAVDRGPPGRRQAAGRLRQPVLSDRVDPAARRPLHGAQHDRRRARDRSLHGPSTEGTPETCAIDAAVTSVAGVVGPRSAGPVATRRATAPISSVPSMSIDSVCITLLELSADRRDAIAGARRGQQHVDIGQAVLGEQAPHVLAHGRPTGIGQGVGLVDDDEHRLVPVLQLAQIALVQRVVGVLLRVHHPDQQVDEGDQPVDDSACPVAIES